MAFRRSSTRIKVASSPARSLRDFCRLTAFKSVGMGQGAGRDNVFVERLWVFVERLWRTIKYEEVHLRAYDTVGQARTSIGRYLAFYNGRRPHSALDRQTPDHACFTRLPHSAAA